MGEFYTLGETKTRPGVYQRYVNNGGAATAGAQNGVVALCVKSNWGELGKVHIFETQDQAIAALGNGGANGTVSDITEAFIGGASLVKVVRLGAGGTKATATMKDTTASPITAINITAKYEGDMPLATTVRGTLGDAASKDFIVYSGTDQLEKFSFTAGGDEVASLITAAAGSKYVSLAKAGSYVGTNVLALYSNAALTGGANPTITNTDYSNAFILLETQDYNAIAVDTNDVAVHALLAAYVSRTYAGGKMGFAVVGEPTSVAIATRQSHAAAFNDYKVVYIGGGWVDSAGVSHEGHIAAARIAGMIAAVPSSESLTHRSIAFAVSTIENLTDSQYEKCINSGMLTFSTSAKKVVWVESAITSLVSPSGQDDAGWKKIKRTKIRFEIMQRANDTVEPLIGNVPNNTDGQSTILKAVQGVLNEMIAESKLLPGAIVALDKTNLPAGDSAWFVITADDVDSLEKIYLTYKFRFSQNV